MNKEDSYVNIAKIVNAHGIKGEVKLVLFLEDFSLFKKFNFITDHERTRSFSFKIKKMSDSGVIASIEGVNDRTEAEKLKGLGLFVNKQELPDASEDEFYYSDLIGLDVLLENKEFFGKVISVHDYGAGDILEIMLDSSKKNFFFPFSKESVPEINLEKGYVVLAAGIIDI